MKGYGYSVDRGYSGTEEVVAGNLRDLAYEITWVKGVWWIFMFAAEFCG